MRRPNLNWEAYADLRRTLDVLTIQGPVEVLRYIASQKYGATWETILAHVHYGGESLDKWLSLLHEEGLIHQETIDGLKKVWIHKSQVGDAHVRWHVSWSTISRINKAISKL